MMSSNELFYGEQVPVWASDTAAYPVRRGSYASESYYEGRPASADYYKSSAYGRQPDYYSGDRYKDYDRFKRGSDYYRSSRPSRYADSDYYQSDAHSPNAYKSSISSATYGAAYDDTYYDSKPNEYYDYRRPSTVVMKVPICCESCSEEVSNSLFELRGVRAVYCDVRKERVTVTGTAAPADVLQVAKKLHKKSRFWGDDDH